MGLILSDFVRSIKDEDISYFSSVVELLKKHRQKVSDYAVALAEIDETRAMLDYSKRTQERLGHDVTQHILLLTELQTEHHMVYQQLLKCKATATIFEHDLRSILMTKYYVHASHVDEWQIDLERKELYRRPKVEMNGT